MYAKNVASFLELLAGDEGAYAPDWDDDIVAESFLDVRAKLLQIAATFDRIDRGRKAGPLSASTQARRELLTEATEILLSDAPNRAEKMQQLFSRQYETDWREQFGLEPQ